MRTRTLLAALIAALLAPGAAMAAPSGVLSHGQKGPSGPAAESQSLPRYWTTHVRQVKTFAPRYILRVPLARKPPLKNPGPPVEHPGALGQVAKLGAARAIRSATGVPWGGSPTSPPATTTGKVFFTDHLGGAYVCSGSLVNSEGKDLVITAGHCVYGTAGGELPRGETWHSNWVFAPGYKNGFAPYGYWTARQLWTMTNYVNHGDEQDDIGAAILNTRNGNHAVNLLGGQGYAWNQSPFQRIFDFGYPAASPFTGQLNEVCSGSDFYNIFIGMEALGCNFTGGSSGGPWLMNFNGTFGYVNGVNDARYSLFPGDITSLYFGNNAGALYNATRGL